MTGINWSRRMFFTVATSSLCTYVMSGCAAARPTLPKGWSTVLVSDAYVPVREEWKHFPAPKEMPLFSDMWVTPSGNSHHLVIGVPQKKSDLAAALLETETSLRSVLPGYRSLGSDIKEERNGLTLNFKDFESHAEFAKSGRLWIFRNDGTTVVGALMAGSLNEEYQNTVQTGMRLTSSNGVDVPEGWGKVGRDGVSFAIPRSWAITGTPVGSKRWRESWADCDPDGTARIRVLLCPATGHNSTDDALAQIESDSIAGSVNGYKRRKAPMSLKYGSEDTSGVRVDYSYDKGSSQGVLWIVQKKESVAAIQMSFSGIVDDNVVGVTQSSIRMEK